MSERGTGRAKFSAKLDCILAKITEPTRVIRRLKTIITDKGNYGVSCYCHKETIDNLEVGESYFLQTAKLNSGYFLIDLIKFQN